MQHRISLIVSLLLLTGCGQTLETAAPSVVLCVKTEDQVIETKEIHAHEDRSIKTLVSSTVIELDQRKDTHISAEDYQQSMRRLYKTVYQQESGIQIDHEQDEHRLKIVITFDFDAISTETLERLGIPVEDGEYATAFKKLIDNYRSQGYSCDT